MSTCSFDKAAQSGGSRYQGNVGEAIGEPYAQVFQKEYVNVLIFNLSITPVYSERT
jgi:hypothetical protein